MSNPTLEIVVGAQYGSEAKGHVTQRLAERAAAWGRYPHIVRVAGPNAGHTGYDKTGVPWALRQVPVASVISSPATLGIAAGSEIDLPVLLDEIDKLTFAGLMQDKILWVSSEATMINQIHKAQEMGDATFKVGGVNVSAGEDLIAKIGSTGKGIGAARADRLMRQAVRLLDDENAIKELTARNVIIAPSRFNIRSMCHNNQHLIVEGTQGFGLGLRAGHYPQVTSSDCRAIDFLSMAGLNPWEFDDVTIWAVARVYPIRVAGNSGPLKDETSWEELGLPEERTTVTKKVRRVGGEDWDLVRDAVEANGKTNVKLALTMLDQKFPEVRDIDPTAPTGIPLPVELGRQIDDYLASIRQQVGVRIGMITTGPNTAAFI